MRYLCLSTGMYLRYTCRQQTRDYQRFFFLSQGFHYWSNGMAAFFIITPPDLLFMIMAHPINAIFRQFPLAVYGIIECSLNSFLACQDELIWRKPFPVSRPESFGIMDQEPPGQKTVIMQRKNVTVDLIAPQTGTKGPRRVDLHPVTIIDCFGSTIVNQMFFRGLSPSIYAIPTYNNRQGVHQPSRELGSSPLKSGVQVQALLACSASMETSLPSAETC